MSHSDPLMENSRELQHAVGLSHRICKASEHLFGDAIVGRQIISIAARYERRCQAILSGRTGDLTTIAIVGSKGQGKTWLARQFLLYSEIQKRLPSGVLSSEATLQLYWIGPTPPNALDANHEVYIPCSSANMFDVGFPYMCLDTPGTTDANRIAAATAHDAMAIAPIQILVVRRDQLRSAAASQIVSQSEGIFCIPVVTAVPLQDFSEDGFSQALESDTSYWLGTMRSSAPNTRFQDAIYLSDFEALGSEEKVSDHFRKELLNRLTRRNESSVGDSTTTRLSSAASRLKYDVYQAIESAAPQLATAVIQMQEAAHALPQKAIVSVLGSELVLETAIRTRLRTRIVSDTSSIWFPYRPTLTLLAFTQGAWDRLILAMTGSVPSLFGTFAAWAKNVQQSRKIQWDMQEGLRERLNLQAIDQLLPIQRQFHHALAQIRGIEEASEQVSGGTSIASEKPATQSVRLAGIDELQSRSQTLFQQRTDEFRTPQWILSFTALLGILVFWALLSGPIVSVYHQYISASYNTFTQLSQAASIKNPLTIDKTTQTPSSPAIVSNKDSFANTPAIHSLVDEFPHPKPSLLVTSILLSFLPMLIYAMIVLTLLLRRPKIARLASVIQSDQHSLVASLQEDGIIRLEFQDLALQHAHFLLGLERQSLDHAISK